MTSQGPNRRRTVRGRIGHGWGKSDFVPARTLLGASGLTTRSMDATRGSWHRY